MNPVPTNADKIMEILAQKNGTKNIIAVIVTAHGKMIKKIFHESLIPGLA